MKVSEVRGLIEQLEDESMFAESMELETYNDEVQAFTLYLKRYAGSCLLSDDEEKQRALFVLAEDSKLNYLVLPSLGSDEGAVIAFTSKRLVRKISDSLKEMIRLKSRNYWFIQGDKKVTETYREWQVTLDTLMTYEKLYRMTVITKDKDVSLAMTAHQEWVKAKHRILSVYENRCLSNEKVDSSEVEEIYNTVKQMMTVR